jgi:ectoine hydroxylase-related dioxygenase (phytanoyl-CoA dioxygenase family)
MGTASDELAKRAAYGQAGRSTGSPAEQSQPMVRISANIQRYGLEENIAELETQGLTVVPPEKAATPEFIDRLRTATVRFIERQDGRTPDFVEGTTHRNQILGDYHYLILHDSVFQELLCQPVAVTLLDYLLGESAIVHANSALCKGPHDELIPGSDLVLPLHSDSQLLPGPFHSFAEFANVTWTLSEYSYEDGSLAYVPGSHLLCRHPMPGEAATLAIPVNTPAGSIICWHGNTWHGAFRRRIPGIRLSIGTIFTRPYIWPRHPLREDVTQGILDANPPRFAKFCGRHVMTNWREEGPVYGPNVVHGYPTRFH